MKFHCRLFLIILLFLTGRPAFGQEHYITLTGDIRDADTELPVPAATVQLKGSSAGTASNAGGRFIFKLAPGAVTDSLQVSCIGYGTITFPVPATGQDNMHLYLQPVVIGLQGVTVSPRNGLSMLQKAIALIPQNYDTANTRLTAFYREFILFNGDTIGYNESVMDILKTFNTTKTNQDQIRLLKGRKLETGPYDDPRFYGWISNITNTAYSSLKEDIQKHTGEPHTFMNPGNFKYYRFDYTGTIRQGNNSLAVIAFGPKKPNKHALVQGKLYIDESSYAIVKCEWGLTQEGVTYVNRHGKGGIGYTIMSKILRASLDFQAATTVVSYQQYGDKWYLSSINRHWNIDVNSPRRNFNATPWIGDFVLQVTDINRQPPQDFTGEAVSRSTSVNHLIAQDYDTAFWGQYNILLPDAPDTIKQPARTLPDSTRQSKAVIHISNRENGFTRADTLRGMLTPLRTCYDVTFYHLDAELDITNRYIRGSNKIRFKAVSAFSRMQLDLYANMQLTRVLYKGRPLHFTREYDAVFIDLPDTLHPGATAELTAYYEGSPQVADLKIPMYGGVLWDHDEQGNPWVQMVCQGSGASLWWPNKDHQSDEPDSMRIWITVPEGYTEISNGRLLQQTPVAGNKVRFEWKVSYPINNYNVSFCIGKYAHFSDRFIRKNHDTLSMDYYVMPYHLQTAQALFQQVKPMLQTFEKYFGPYPFPRDGFTLLESPYPMEHQSGVCIGKIFKDTAMLLLPPVVWHEAAHEWWGNAITSKDIADMWIHEGFATYAESLVIENDYGKDAALEFLNGQKGAVLNHEPVIGVYNVNHIHYDISDMYSKASLLLNTIRSILDDDARWFALLKTIQQHFRYQTITSDELVGFICRETKQNLYTVFDQYLKCTRLPTFTYTLKEKGKDLELRYHWKADVPGFNMPLKVGAENNMRFVYPTTQWQTLTLKNMSEDDFEIDEDGFYVNAEQLSTPSHTSAAYPSRRQPATLTAYSTAQSPGRRF